jgi:hypothetical protein
MGAPSYDELATLATEQARVIAELLPTRTSGSGIKPGLCTGNVFEKVGAPA